MILFSFRFLTTAAMAMTMVFAKESKLVSRPTKGGLDSGGSDNTFFEEETLQ